MNYRSFKLFAVAVLLLGMTGCTAEVDNPSSTDVNALEQSLVGLWWDEFEYADVTEAGVPFSRVILAVQADADHTGCIYLGAFDDTGDEPLAVYGGPEDAGFTWRLLADGRVLLGDPATGETYALSRSRGDDGGSYGEGMTNVASTNVTYTDGSVTVTNGNYSGELVKADADQAADIKETLSTLSPDRQNFEAHLSQMLAESQQYIKLDPTMRGVKLLTDFVNQLKIDALAPQLNNIILTVLARPNIMKGIDFNGAETEEAHWAMTHSNFADEAATMFGQVNASIVLNNSTLEFTTDKDTAQYAANDTGMFTISCKNASSGAVTKVRMKFSGDDDGVIIFLANLHGTPLAIQFPHAIDMELLRSESGSDADEETVMKGQLMLESTEGKRYISLKHSGWRATLRTEAQKADRYEMPACELVHHADHTIEVSASLGINGRTVATVKAHNDNNPYTDAEIEQLRDLRDIAPIWKGCYTLLKAFNSRSGQIELTAFDSLVFDVNVLDAGNSLRAIGNALNNRRELPVSETIDPWTNLLNQSVTFTMTHQTTGVKADGKFITSSIAGVNLPSLALRFAGESDFRVIHDRMNATDLQNYEALLKGFGEPFRAVNALLKAIQDKGEQLKELKSKAS